MVKNISLVILLMVGLTKTAAQNDKTLINTALNQWHQAAADAQFQKYFNFLTSDAIFIGTDPTENWNVDAFKAFAKPYFDKGKAWNFKTLERNIYLSGDLAWFDELLDTQMKICRGSGVMRKTAQGWKIQHYVLSIAIPNENTDEVVMAKAAFDDALLTKLRKE
jgi:ketosteroid isomerase-like protein